jgi:hypothetical protein
MIDTEVTLTNDELRGLIVGRAAHLIQSIGNGQSTPDSIAVTLKRMVAFAEAMDPETRQ